MKADRIGCWSERR